MSEVKAGAILAYVNVAVSNLVALLYTPILVRFLGQGNFGVYKLSDSVIASLSLLSLGFGAAYVRFYSRLKVNNDRHGIANLNGMYLLLFTGMGLLACLAGWILVALTPQLFGSGLHPAELSLAKTLMLLMTLNVALTFPSSIFSSYVLVHEKFKWIYGIMVILKILGPAVGIAMLLAGWGAVGASVASLLITVISFICNALYATRRLGMKFKFLPFSFTQLREVAAFSFWIFLSQVFNIITDNSSSFILASRSGAINVAIFAVAFQMRQLFFALSTALSGVFTPRVNTLVAETVANDSLLHLMIRVGRYQLILHLVLLGGFILVGQYFIHLWVGEGYAQAYWLTLIMVVSVTAPLIQNLGIQIQQAKNMHRFRSVVYLVSALGGAIVCWFLTPQFGSTAGACGYAFTMIAGPCIAMNWHYHHRIGLHMGHFWKKMVPVVAVIGGSTILFLIITLFFIPVTTVTRLVCVGVLYVVVSGSATWRFVLSQGEKGELRALIPRGNGTQTSTDKESE